MRCWFSHRARRNGEVQERNSPLSRLAVCGHGPPHAASSPACIVVSTVFTRAAAFRFQHLRWPCGKIFRSATKARVFIPVPMAILISGWGAAGRSPSWLSIPSARFESVDGLQNPVERVSKASRKPKKATAIPDRGRAWHSLLERSPASPWPWWACTALRRKLSCGPIREAERQKKNPLTHLIIPEEEWRAACQGPLLRRSAGNARCSS